MKVETQFLGEANELDLDPDTLDSGMHYRFVQERGARQARALKQGYRVVSRSQDGVRRLTDPVSVDGEPEGSADDIIRDGDTVLMACPKKVFEGRDAKQAEIKRARLATPVAKFKRKAREAQVNITTSTKEVL